MENESNPGGQGNEQGRNAESTRPGSRIFTGRRVLLTVSVVLLLLNFLLDCFGLEFLRDFANCLFLIAAIWLACEAAWRFCGDDIQISLSMPQVLYDVIVLLIGVAICSWYLTSIRFLVIIYFLYALTCVVYGVRFSLYYLGKKPGKGLPKKFLTFCPRSFGIWFALVFFVFAVLFVGFGIVVLGKVYSGT